MLDCFDLTEFDYVEFELDMHQVKRNNWRL